MTCIFASVLYSIRFEIFSIFAGYLYRIFFFSAFVRDTVS